MRSLRWREIVVPSQLNRQGILPCRQESVNSTPPEQILQTVAKRTRTTSCQLVSSHKLAACGTSNPAPLVSEVVAAFDEGYSAPGYAFSGIRRTCVKDVVCWPVFLSRMESPRLEGQPFRWLCAEKGRRSCGFLYFLPLRQESLEASMTSQLPLAAATPFPGLAPVVRKGTGDCSA